MPYSLSLSLKLPTRKETGSEEKVKAGIRRPHRKNSISQSNTVMSGVDFENNYERRKDDNENVQCRYKK